MSEVDRNWTVTGKVQGVGFRWYVARTAQKLRLVGRVRNLGDGGVEVLARGKEPVLQALEEALKEGPMLAHVEEVVSSDVPSDFVFPNSFEIA